MREKYEKAFYDFAPEIRYMIAELSQMSEKEKDMKIRNDVLAAISSKFSIEKSQNWLWNSYLVEYENGE